jgi:hypothetical protein
MFGLSWMPLFVLDIVIDVETLSDHLDICVLQQTRSYHVFHYFCVVLILLGCAFSPILYILFFPKVSH